MDNGDRQRSFRCDDELWLAAQRTAEKRGDGSLSNIIRGYLARYVTEDSRSRHPAGTGRPGQSRPPTQRSEQ